MWRVVEALVHSGLSSTEAIECIYTHYGQGTDIIPALRVAMKQPQIVAYAPIQEITNVLYIPSIITFLCYSFE